MRAGAASLAPLLRLRLRLGDREVAVSGLIDTGAAVSVLPWSVGVALGGDWGAAAPVTLSGNLAPAEARVLAVEGLVGGGSGFANWRSRGRGPTRSQSC